MLCIQRTLIERVNNQYPKPEQFQPSYGTAGFRADASVLASTLLRCGMFAAVLAKSSGKAYGLMITASHNKYTDNGVKIVEADGSMLAAEWEDFVTRIVCSSSLDELLEQLDLTVHACISKFPTNGTLSEQPMHVLLGHDTRPSASVLLEAAAAGVQAAGANPVVLGLLTTPQLHFSVLQYNVGRSEGLTSYYQLLRRAFLELLIGTSPIQGKLYVDCANGVGALKLEELHDLLISSGLDLHMLNTGGGILNDCVGADFVQKSRIAPMDCRDMDPSARYSSMDGDADRLVYFTVNKPSESSEAESPEAPASVSLYDGDKIAVLAATFIGELLALLPRDIRTDLKVGIVQTAYANSASTSYITSTLGLPVVCTPTGVKHLHHAALALDIGLYWESNGHGTVTFSESLLEKLKKVSEGDGASARAAKDLLSLSQLINQCVGDALSNLLLVEVILRRKQWSLADWGSLYTDLPSRQLVVVVPDRSAITTTDAERCCVTPPGLQPAINALVAEYPGSRCFVRPSGTEDAVRIYTEGQSQEEADSLAQRVSSVVKEICG